MAMTGLDQRMTAAGQQIYDVGAGSLEGGGPPSRAASVIHRKEGALKQVVELCEMAEAIANRIVGPPPPQAGPNGGSVPSRGDGLLGELEALNDQMQSCMERLRDALARVHEAF